MIQFVIRHAVIFHESRVHAGRKYSLPTKGLAALYDICVSNKMFLLRYAWFNTAVLAWFLWHFSVELILLRMGFTECYRSPSELQGCAKTIIVSQTILTILRDGVQW